LHTGLNASTSITIINTTISAVFIQWLGPETGGNVNEVNHYIVTWSFYETETGNKFTDDNYTSTQISNLTSNTKFTISVTAVDDDGRSGKESKLEIFLTCWCTACVLIVCWW